MKKFIFLTLLLFQSQNLLASTVTGYYYIIDKSVYTEQLEHQELRKLSKAFVLCRTPDRRGNECSSAFTIDGTLTVVIIRNNDEHTCALSTINLDKRVPTYETFFYKNTKIKDDPKYKNEGKYVCIYKVETFGNK